MTTTATALDDGYESPSDLTLEPGWQEHRAIIELKRELLLRSLQANKLQLLELESLLDIPENATLRSELVRCGRARCSKKHGPYQYAYWREGGRLRKRYIRRRVLDEIPTT